LVLLRRKAHLRTSREPYVRAVSELKCRPSGLSNDDLITGKDVATLKKLHSFSRAHNRGRPLQREDASDNAVSSKRREGECDRN
jgi:hypothetical protein